MSWLKTVVGLLADTWRGLRGSYRRNRKSDMADRRAYVEARRKEIDEQLARRRQK